MARYIKRFQRVGMSLGPSEERSFEIWVGFDIEGHAENLEHLGLIRVDDEEIAAERDVKVFTHIRESDVEMLEKLGLA